MDHSFYDEKCGENPRFFPDYLSALRDGVLYATPSRHLRAYDLRDGSELWSYHDRDFCVQAIAPVKNRIILIQTRWTPPPYPYYYAHEIDPRFEYFVVALNAKTGATLWRTEIQGDILHGSLVVEGDSIYVAGRLLWDQIEHRLPSKDNHRIKPQVHALDLESGSIRWTRPLQVVEDSAPLGRIGLRANDQGVLVHKINNHYGWGAEFFEAATGTRRWTLPPPTLDRTKPSRASWLGRVANGRFYVIQGKELRIHSLATGEEIESVEDERWEFGMRKSDERNFYHYQRRVGTLHAFDWKTRNLLWTQKLGVKENWKNITRGVRAMDIQDGVISIGGEDGCFYLINAEDGAILRRSSGCGYHTESHPAFIFGGAVIVSGHRGIISFRPND